MHGDSRAGSVSGANKSLIKTTNVFEDLRADKPMTRVEESVGRRLRTEACQSDDAGTDACVRGCRGPVRRRGNAANERGGPVEHLLGGCRTKVIAVADNGPANQWLAVPLVV